MSFSGHGQLLLTDSGGPSSLASSVSNRTRGIVSDTGGGGVSDQSDEETEEGGGEKVWSGGMSFSYFSTSIMI